MSGEENDAVFEAVVALVPALLNALEAIQFTGRHLHPPHLAELVATVGTRDAPLREALDGLRGIDWPERLAFVRDRLEAASVSTMSAFDGLRAAAGEAGGVLQAYRALRHYVRAVEALYPLAPMLPAISRFFLEEPARGDEMLLQRLAKPRNAEARAGILEARNEKTMRGGFSLYVPEYYDAGTAYPLIMALHGGSGHGRDFLWTWIREARTRGAILVSPTSMGDTWSLMEPELDIANLERMLAFVREGWNVDPSRMLITGMSDGGTFTYLSGLSGESPFTHLAPISASFHPMLLSFMDAERMAGLPIHIVHGALDWMFPAAMARSAEEALKGAGAKVTYHEIADLSHTYPREENAAIMDWFLG